MLAWHSMRYPIGCVVAYGGLGYRFFACLFPILFPRPRAIRRYS